MLPCTDSTEIGFPFEVNTDPVLVKFNVLPMSPVAIAALPINDGSNICAEAPIVIPNSTVSGVFVGTLSNGQLRWSR